jgi:hypothetical protein
VLIYSQKGNKPTIPLWIHTFQSFSFNYHEHEGWEKQISEDIVGKVENSDLKVECETRVKIIDLRIIDKEISSTLLYGEDAPKMGLME